MRVLGCLIILILTTANSQAVMKSTDLQASFNQLFCAGCCSKGFESIHQQNINNVANRTGYNVSHQNIENNTYFSELVTKKLTVYNQTLRFNTTAKSFNITYLLALPQFENVSLIKGVVGYFHPTIFDKAAVPTNPHLGKQYKALIGLYASNGYILVLPDYVGLGNTYKQMHPYVLFPEQNAETMQISLNDAYTQIVHTYGTINPLKVFTVGYSQGGAYSIWFGSCMNGGPCYNRFPLRQELDLVYFAGLEGAYDLSRVQISFLLENVSKSDGNKYQISTQTETNLGKPGLTALTIASYATYGDTRYPLNSYFNQSFFLMMCTDIDQFQCNCENPSFERQRRDIGNALQQESIINLAEAFANDAYNKYLKGSAYMKKSQTLFSSKNSVFSFVNEDLINSNYLFIQTLRKATLVNNGKNTSIYKNKTFVFTLQRDSLVSPNNTFNFLNFTNAQSQNVDFQIFPNDQFTVCLTFSEIDHLKGELIGNIYALNQFNSIFASNFTTIEKKKLTLID